MKAIKYLILLGLCITQAMAVSFEVEMKGYAYQALISKEKISLKSHLMNLSIEKKSCNEGILRKLEQEFDKKSKSLVVTKKSKNKLLYKIENKDYLLDQQSPFARFLFTFPQILQQAKKSEQLACFKK